MAQETNEIIPRTSLNDTIRKFIANNSITDTLTYFLNGKKVDITKTYIDIDDIKSISVPGLRESESMSGNLLNSKELHIITKNEIELISVLEQIKTKNFDSGQITSLKLTIDNVDISNPDIMLDSAIDIIFLNTGDVHDPKPSGQKSNFIGVIIFTNLKAKRKIGSHH